MRDSASVELARDDDDPTAQATGAPPVETNTPAVPATNTPPVTNLVPGRSASDGGTVSTFVQKSIDYEWRMPIPPATTTPTTSTTTTTTTSAMEGMGGGGCMARALRVLDTRITPQMPNECAESLFNDTHNRAMQMTDDNIERYYAKDSHWPAAAILGAFKKVELDTGKPFIFRKLKFGNDYEMSHSAPFRRMLQRPGKQFIVEGLLNTTFKCRSRRTKMPANNDDDDEDARHCVAIKNGKLVDKSYFPSWNPKLQEVLHIGPNIQKDGFFRIILKAYEIG